MVNGNRVPYIGAARYEGKRVAARLSRALHTTVGVQPVIAVVHAERLTIRRRPDDVAVVSRRRLRGFLRGFHPILSQEQVEYAFGLARLESVWR